MKSNFTINSILALLSVCVALCGMPAFAQYGNGPKLASADPASGSKVDSLSTIILTMDMETADAVKDWGMESAELPAVFGASANVKATLWYPVGDLTKLKITISPTLTQDGTYEITIPEGYISNNDWEYNQEIKLVYTIGSGSSGEDPVQYDLNYTSINPESGTYEVLDTITLTFDTDVFTDSKSRANLYRDNMLYLAARMSVRDGNKVDLLFKNFDIEGTYELVIDKSQIGDAKWFEGHHLGHANPEIRIPGYRIKKSVSKLTYDFVPVLTPDDKEVLESIDKISLRFAGSWCSASQEQILLYDSNDNTYPLTVSMGDSLDEAILNPASPVTKAGQYRLVVPKARFGNSDFEESEGLEGALNPEIKASFEVNPTLDVQDILTDGITVSVKGDTLELEGNGNVTIYTIQGICCACLNVNGNAMLSLPSGLYIINTGNRTYKTNIK